MLQQEISKICADSLRSFAKENYETKLKAAHAHELVSAYFGYKTKNAMLADDQYPIGRLNSSEVIILIPDEIIDDRRKKLDGLPENLPDSYSLGEAVFVPLFADESLYTSQFPPFRSFKGFAKFYVENNEAYKSAFNMVKNMKLEHIVDVKEKDGFIEVSVTHCYRVSDDELSGFGQTIIELPRVAGRIGYGKPRSYVEKWAGGFRKSFKLSEIG